MPNPFCPELYVGVPGVDDPAAFTGFHLVPSPVVSYVSVSPRTGVARPVVLSAERRHSVAG